MIGVIGVKRILTIVVLLLLNAALAAVVYMHFVPRKMAAENELNQLRGNISTVQSDISRMQVEFDQLQLQQVQFDKMRQRGFFGSQGRREAELILQKIQRESGVISAVVNIMGGVVEANEEALKAEHQVLASPVSIRIEAMDDVDVYRYIYLVQQFFPGHVSFEKLSLKREAEVSGTVMRAIATGANPKLVSAEIVMTWRTMIPQKDVIGAPVDPSGGQ